MSKTVKWIIGLSVAAIAGLIIYFNWDKIKLWWTYPKAIQRQVPTIPAACPDWSTYQYSTVSDHNSPYNNNLSFNQSGNSCPSCIMVNGIKYIINGSIGNPAINNTICFYKPLNSGT